MNKRLLVYVSLFTVLVCVLFVNYNPNIASEFPSTYDDGEVFTPHNGKFDLKGFTITSDAHNFTAKTKTIGHTQFTDDTGDVIINCLELDNMIQSSRDWHENLLDEELKRPSWSVDGVMVHEISFMFGDEAYSAYIKNSTGNKIIYLSTPNEQETADIVNSLKFKDE